MSIQLSESQVQLAQLPQKGALFLEGPAGTGKTTAAAEHFSYLLSGGVPGESILVLVPQRTLTGPYQSTLQRAAISGSLPSIVTIGGLARRLVNAYWPMVSAQAGFACPQQPPVFLTLETAQYYLARLLRPRLDAGLFGSVVIDPNRLYSQILDNLNKAAVVGFPISEIGTRLQAAWIGDPGQVNVYDDVQTSVNLFRQFCLEHNLLDFSLQMEIFSRHLWRNSLSRSYLTTTYRHLIFDNLEEDTPIAHDVLVEWLPEFTSAFLVYDWEGGFRTFLGADPGSAYRLKALCSEQHVFTHSWVVTPGIQQVGHFLSSALAAPGLQHIQFPKPDFEITSPAEKREPFDPLDQAVKFSYHRFYPQMLDWVAVEIERLIHQEGIDPQEIVVLAPYLPDVLQFSLMQRLQTASIPVRSHRPSHSLRDEPAARCLLTLSALAFTEWQLAPDKSDVAYALMQAIKGMDLVRARLLTEIIYQPKQGIPRLTSFDQIKGDAPERITYRLGARYESLRLWLERAASTAGDLDHFISRLFGEVLSQPGYGFHGDFDAGQVTASLVESIQKFRRVASEIWVTRSNSHQQASDPAETQSLGREYFLLVQQGLIAAQYVAAWQGHNEAAVLLAPATTFLMSNHPVQVQFWLDIGSHGWLERLYQPLTHPYVLARDWPPGRPWTDQDEVAAGQQALYRLVLGLLRRCRSSLYLGISELGEQGYEQRSEFLRAFQRALQQLSSGEEAQL